MQHRRADHTGVVSQLCRNQFAVRLIKALSRRPLAQRSKEELSRAAHAAADGNDLVYVTVQVADKNGNIVPTDTRMVSFKVSGAAEFLATANGDPTCLLSFDDPKMKLFSGAATAILRAASTPGLATLTVTAPGVKSATISIDVK